MLTAMLLATPLFGLSLTPPDMASLNLRLNSQIFAQPLIASPLLPQDDWDEDWEEEEEEEAAEPKKAEPETLEPKPADKDDEWEEEADKKEETAEPPRDKGPTLSKEEYAEQVQTRSDLSDIHRVMGIATWGAMTATLVGGTIQYYNLYGFGSGIDNNPCVEGSAIFGQGQCSGTPWLHLGGALVTTALYSTTFALSLAMPDPNDLANGKGEYADKLSLHKTLRWVHFAGMLAQMGLGLLIANSEVIGLDRANDYGTLQALSTVHLGVGLVTWGALSWAGALFTF